MGRRARSANGSGTVVRDFALDGGHEIEERENNVTKAQYVFGVRVDEPLVYEKNLDGTAPFDPIEDRLYYHENALGSVIGLTNGNAQLKEGYLYDAYGRQTVYRPGLNGVVDWGDDDSILVGGISGLDNPYLFTARRLDAESGLYYYRARHLDPEQGRFLQAKRGRS